MHKFSVLSTKLILLIKKAGTIAVSLLSCLLWITKRFLLCTCASEGVAVFQDHVDCDRLAVPVHFHGHLVADPLLVVQVFPEFDHVGDRLSIHFHYCIILFDACCLGWRIAEDFRDHDAILHVFRQLEDILLLGRDCT